MNAQLNYIRAQEHIVELHREGQRERLATEAPTERRNSRVGNPITRLRARLAHLTARPAPSRP